MREAESGRLVFAPVLLRGSGGLIDPALLGGLGDTQLKQRETYAVVVVWRRSTTWPFWRRGARRRARWRWASTSAIRRAGHWRPTRRSCATSCRWSAACSSASARSSASSSYSWIRSGGRCTTASRRHACSSAGPTWAKGWPRDKDRTGGLPGGGPRPQKQ